MTTAGLVTHVRTMNTAVRPRRSLEELVDQLLTALFSDDSETATPMAMLTPASAIHEARRMRQAGEIDDALAVLGSMDMSGAETRQARWAFSEWRQLVKRRFGDREALVYSQGTGRAAALVPHDDDTLEVVAVLGMRWSPGKIVSVRSLRGLRPPGRACP